MDIREQAYHALQTACQRIMTGEFRQAKAAWIKKHQRHPLDRDLSVIGRSIIIPAEVAFLIEASSDALGGRLDPEEAMSYLRHPEVLRLRLAGPR